MADTSPDSESPDSFSSPSTADEGAGFDEADAPPWEREKPEFGQEEMEESFAVDMARLWVKQHQKATMLGAFAVGVFVGALLRD